jgi:ribosomal protein S18 acetylase RimI-like enzyme
VLALRLATAADAERIARVHVDGWRWGYRGLLDPCLIARHTEASRAAEWRGWLGQEGRRDLRVLLAEEDGEPVGFLASGDPREPDDTVRGLAEIYAIYVSEAGAGKGVGRALMARAAEEHRAQGYAGAVLWVLGTNARARAFYEGLGWREDGATKAKESECGTSVQRRYRRSL